MILTPDNAKRLLHALEDNIAKFEEQQRRGGSGNSGDDFYPPIGGIKGEA